MSEIKVNKISPATGTDITLGDSGDTLTVPSGGTIVNSGTATGFGGGQWTKIKSQEITSSTATMEWIHGTDDVVFDGTYTKYMLSISKLKPVTDNVYFYGVLTTDGGSTWKTSSYKGSIVDLWWNGNTTGVGNTSVYLYTRQWANDSWINGFIWFQNPALSNYPSCNWNLHQGYNKDNWSSNQIGGGGYLTSGAYDGFKLYFSSGNIATMKATLYGTIDGA